MHETKLADHGGICLSQLLGGIIRLDIALGDDYEAAVVFDDLAQALNRGDVLCIKCEGGSARITW